jgi:hypothetical protein
MPMPDWGSWLPEEMPMPDYNFIRHSVIHMIFQYNIARITTSEAVYGRAGWIYLHYQQYERAGCILIPQPAVWTRHAGRIPLYHQYGLARCVAFHSQQNGRAGCNQFHSQEYMDVQCAGCMCFHCQQYSMLCRICAFLSTAVWTCRVYPFFKCRNVRLSGSQSVRYQNEQKCRCQNLSGARKRGHSSLLECSSTGLRYRMRECWCRRHRSRCRCPVMVL